MVKAGQVVGAGHRVAGQPPIGQGKFVKAYIHRLIGILGGQHHLVVLSVFRQRAQGPGTLLRT